MRKGQNCTTTKLYEDNFARLTILDGRSFLLESKKKQKNEIDKKQKKKRQINKQTKGTKKSY